MSYRIFQDPESDNGFLQKIEDTTQLSGNYQYFGLFFGIGLFFMLLSLFFIPSIPINPGKFSSLSAIGSLCMFCSLVFLKGVKSCVEGMFEGERKLYALGYCAALLMTFLASMVFQNYLAALLGALAQLVAVSYLGCSYIPGGVTTVTFLFKGTLTCIKQTVTSLFS